MRKRLIRSWDSMDTLFHTFFYFFAPPNALSLVETQDVFVIMHIIRGKLYFVLELPFIKKTIKHTST